MSPAWPTPVPPQQALEQALMRRARGFVPEWDPGALGAGRALSVVFAHYLRTVQGRLEQAPEKNAVALLDLAGLGPAPPQSARAPLIFRLAKDAASGTAPAGTPVSAPPAPGSSNPIVFETEQALGLMSAQVAQVASLWPERDQYIDHTAELASGRPARMFARDLLQPIPHRLYLSHPTLLALAGNVDLAVEIRLTQASAEPLEIDWRYWDGEVWRGFLKFVETGLTEDGSFDGTGGLRRTGVVRLRASCAQSVETAVNGIPGFWIRGSLAEPLLPDDGSNAATDRSALLPGIETIRISTILVRRFDAALELRSFGGQPIRAIASMSAQSLPGMTGKIVNEAGQPLAGAVVTLHWSGADAPLAISDPSKADGLFGLQFPDSSEPRQYFLRATFFDLSADVALPAILTAEHARIGLILAVKGLAPDKAFADGTELDLTKPFLPFGAQPQPGSTFAFTSAEVFSKSGAMVRLYLPRTVGPQDMEAPEGASKIPHLLAWEYWNGRAWAPLGIAPEPGGLRRDFSSTEIVDLTVPSDMEPVELNGVEARWMRVRIVSGGYGYTQEIVWESGSSHQTNRMGVAVIQPPAIAGAIMSYTWQYGPFQPECVLVENDMVFADKTYETKWPGHSFQPFTPSADSSPSLYIGFDAKPPSDAVSLFLDIAEHRHGPIGPPLDWEYWDGFSWRRLSTNDETENLRVPGIVSFLGAADSVPLARFGTALHWVRARLQHSEEPSESQLDAVHPNAVWASERRTLRDLALGSSNGTPSQCLVIAQVPVLAGERIEVRESIGARARTEWRQIALQLEGIDDRALSAIEDLLNRSTPDPDVVYGRLRLRRNARKEVAEVWVGWEGVPSLLSAGPRDRVYALDRTRGRLFFGDGHRGMVPSLGGAVMARLLQSGGGSRGNLPAKAISQLIGAVAGAEEVFNLKPSEGGSDGESLAAFRKRGPKALRHRGRAVTAQDVEALAREASAAVGFARVVPILSAAGRRVAGHLTLIIIPASAEALPYPTRGLRQRVQDFVARRASATLAGGEGITVTGPDYRLVDISATLTPIRSSEAGDVEKAARAALLAFLHPLSGGPNGEGWDIGRGVHLSDIATILEGVLGLDFARDLTLLAGGIPQGEMIEVAADRIVAAGTISLALKAREA